MPLEFKDDISEKGLRILRIEGSGQVTIADGHAFEAHLLPGAPYHLGYLMSVVAKDTEYSPEVRKFFPTTDDKITAIAIVVTSPIVRAVINMMMRVSNKRTKVRLFTDEAEAIAWLDEQA